MPVKAAVKIISFLPDRGFDEAISNICGWHSRKPGGCRPVSVLLFGHMAAVPWINPAMSDLDVLLATYNGARFLPELLHSLEEQSHRDFRLIVRDDGSTDDSVDIVERWSKPAGIDTLFLRDGDRGLGAKGNFARLLEASDRPYFMLCDQDDVWLPHKVEAARSAIVSAEHRAGPTTPVLAHCDLKVVGEDLQIMDQSFWKHQRFKSTYVDRSHASDPVRKGLLIRNFVTGCATIGNAALRQRALPIPDESAMHDWWLALIAAYLGEIRSIDEPGLLYRQHISNSLGAKNWSARSIAGKLLTEPKAAIGRSRYWLEKAKGQAQRIEAILDKESDGGSPAYLKEFARIDEASLLSRKTYMLRHGVSAQTNFHSLVTWLLL
jgi:glycosyltransferase involved in cell wall biosynthesis